MYDYRKDFLSMNRAEKFIEDLRKNGITDIILESRRDCFGDTIWQVAWNKD